MKTGLSAIGLAVVGVVVVVALAIAGWQLNWFVKSKDVNRNAQILNNSYGRQTALVDAINKELVDAQTPGLPDGQRKAIVAQLCDNAGHLTGTITLSLVAREFIAKECTP